MTRSELSALALRHRRLGWSTLLVFLTIGLALETLHGFKVGFYLDVSNEVRRHLWTLAHAHGALLGLVHLGLAATVATAAEVAPPTSSTRAHRPLRVASTALGMATVLLPGGFLLGGSVIYGGDPGLGILLVPVGGVCLAVAVAGALRSQFPSGA